jgi:hypothetical protein
MTASAFPRLEFRPVEESDFPTLAAWLAQRSQAVGFRPLRTFLEEGVELMLFRRKRS